MAKFFRKKKKSGPLGPKKSKPRRRKVDERDLVDPIGYNGELDEEKYPILPIEVRDKDEKPEEEIENPLNKR